MSTNEVEEVLEPFLLDKSDAYLEFFMALSEANILRALYDSERAKSTSQSTSRDVLKRSGVILAITAWEIYIEKSFTDYFRRRIDKADSPNLVRSVFNSVAQAWLDSKPKPPDLAKWTSTGWKEIVLERFIRDIQLLNTPNSTNIRRLSKLYLGLDVTNAWKWQGMSPVKACRNLDNLIKLRGRLVHRGRDGILHKSLVTRGQLVKGLTLVLRLANRTEAALAG